MKFLAIILAAASVAVAQVPSTFSSFSEANCTGTALATYHGVTEDAGCYSTGDIQSLNITRRTADSNCDVPAGGLSERVPVTTGCFTSTMKFESVRIVCV
ncbi:hypothetical protein DFH06DRAFT_1338175 [Mycena polygramma]|nr:hypothetical protein DFH06DRAFT_1338175 [Mycena polygramma]